MQPVEDPTQVISSGSPRGVLIMAVAVLALGLLVLAAVLVVAGREGQGEGDDEDGTRLAAESGFDADRPGGLDPAGARPEGAVGEPSQRPGSSGPPTTAAAFEGNLLLDGPEPVLEDLANVVGADVELTELVIYPTYAIVTYRSPDDPANLDSLWWREGAFEAPEPEGFVADEPEALFTLEGVALEQLPNLSGQALDGFALGGGEVTHAIVDRFTFLDDGAVAIRVYVSHPERGGGGYLLARADGTFVELVG